jgi:hypothetical protein
MNEKTQARERDHGPIDFEAEAPPRASGVATR